MLKTKVISLVILLSMIFLLSNDTDATLTSSQSTPVENLESYHSCIDSTHIACDGLCECDGLGCN